MIAPVYCGNDKSHKPDASGGAMQKSKLRMQN
jgi:hypothetical protein